MDGITRLVLPYTPREQFRPYHRRSERFAVIVAHRRAGKTVATVNDKIKRAIQLTIPHGRYAYVAPFLAQAKEVAWEYLKRFAEPLIRDKNEGELWVDLINGARIRIHGADNPDRLRGAYLDGVTLDEYADMRPSVWGEVIRPMLADRNGWATFIGTPKGRNEFFGLWERARADDAWLALMLRASESGIIAASELEQARADMTPEQYAQEFECSFDAAIVGAYYGRELAEAERDGRLGTAQIDPYAPVHTAWDLGVGDATAIWFFQCIGPAIFVVDYYESHGMSAAHYCKVVRGKPWFTEDCVAYVPHDAKVREWAMDGHADGRAKQRIEVLVEHGVNPRLVRQHKEMDGINAARMLLPIMHFDADRCGEGIEALRQFRADYDERLRTFRDTPKPDWTNHCADAFRYMAMAYREMYYPKADPEAERAAELIAARQERLKAAGISRTMRRAQGR